MADLSHDTHDDAFHEIQLSGKQLVFLFMATTVISVVIFLCGVLVGRGVRAEDLGVDATLAAATEPAPADARLAPGPPAAETPTPPAEEPLTYAERLDSPKPPTETLRSQTASETKALEDTKRPEPDETKPPEARERRQPGPAAEPPRAHESPVAAPPAQGAKPGTWAVQVVSLRDHGAANRLMHRLRGKSYPAFIIAPSSGAPTQLYKVQIGRYGDRGEAERIAARLKKEEQFEPFIVR